jgi:hypothetical protein
MFQPNYEKPSRNQYLNMLNDEILLTQIVELHEKNGNHEEASYIRGFKKFVMIRRKCMKAALKQKEKAASAGTLTA